MKTKDDLCGTPTESERNDLVSSMEEPLNGANEDQNKA